MKFNPKNREVILTAHKAERKNVLANALIEENRRLREEIERLNQQIKSMEVHT